VCLFSWECEGKQVCDPLNGKCRDPGYDGYECGDDDSACQDDLHCLNGHCQKELLPDGHRCGANYRCESNCCEYYCSSGGTACYDYGD
jgi:hypothetical protein